MSPDSSRSKRLTLAGLLGAGVWSFAPGALAAGGGGGGGRLEIFLLLVAVVGAAYLIAHLLIERVAERFGVVTGVEYIVLGAVVFRFIAAPVMAGETGEPVELQVQSIIDKLRPVLVLGTGALGLLWGAHVDLRRIDAVDRASFLPALVVSAVTFTTVSVLPAAGIAYWYSFERVIEASPLLVCAGAVAMVAADGPIQSLVSFLDARGDAPKIAGRITGWCSALAIATFGIMFCFDHAWSASGGLDLSPLQWFFVHIVIGGTLGLIFGTFLRRDFSGEKILTVVIGMVVFTSGLAYGLDLSPIFVNFLLGGVLINTCRQGDHIRQRLESIKHPLYIVLFLFAGAKLDFGVPYWAYLMAGPYLLLRLAGRWIGGAITTPSPEGQPALPPLGRVLFAPGALSIAMAIDFEAIYSARESALLFGFEFGVESFYSGLVVAIIVSEILAYLMTRSWLIDAAHVPTSPGDRAHGAGVGTGESREVS